MRKLFTLVLLGLLSGAVGAGQKTGVTVNGISVGDNTSGSGSPAWAYNEQRRQLTLTSYGGEYTISGEGCLKINIAVRCKVIFDNLRLDTTSLAAGPCVSAERGIAADIEVSESTLKANGDVALMALGANLKIIKGYLAVDSAQSEEYGHGGVLVNSVIAETGGIQGGFVHAEDSVTINYDCRLNSHLRSLDTYRLLSNSVSVASLNAKTIRLKRQSELQITGEHAAGMTGDDILISGGHHVIGSTAFQFKISAGTDDVLSPEYKAAAIGPGIRRTSTTAKVTITGGDVIAYGYSGIGSGWMDKTGPNGNEVFGTCETVSIVIDGGRVTALAHDQDDSRDNDPSVYPAIGSFCQNTSFTLEISDGEVTAEGSSRKPGGSRETYGGPAIGVSQRGKGGSVLITGGRLKATGRYSAAIGRGYGNTSAAVDVTIKGGDVELYGGYECPAVEVTGAVKILGGTVWAECIQGMVLDVMDIGNRHGETQKSFKVGGGAVYLAHGTGKAVDESGKSCRRVLVSGLPYAPGEVVTVSGLSNYGVVGLKVRELDGPGEPTSLALMLPRGSYSFSVEEGRCTATVIDADVEATRNFYVVTFDSGGYTYPVAPMLCEPDRVYTLPTGESRSELQCIGWRDEAGKKRYDLGMNVFNLAKAGERVELHAVWPKPKRYMIVNLLTGKQTFTDEIKLNDETDYRSVEMVLRYIEPGTFTMGDQVHGGDTYPNVRISKSYYIGIYEVTQSQWYWVMKDEEQSGKINSQPAYYYNNVTRPVECVSYDMIRGKPDELKDGGWPANNEVAEHSFLGVLRKKTGLEFDLPTEAQWEYAARSGTTTDYGNGTNYSDENYDANMDVVGRSVKADSPARYEPKGWSQTVDPAKGGTAIVGSYAPNRWGLYDMHGNVMEWCLDRRGELQGDVTDPRGSTTVPYYVLRGGAFDRHAFQATSWFRTANDSLLEDANVGLRLCCPAVE